MNTPSPLAAEELDALHEEWTTAKEPALRRAVSQKIADRLAAFPMVEGMGADTRDALRDLMQNVGKRGALRKTATAVETYLNRVSMEEFRESRLQNRILGYEGLVGDVAQKWSELQEILKTDETDRAKIRACRALHDAQRAMVMARPHDNEAADCKKAISSLKAMGKQINALIKASSFSPKLAHVLKQMADNSESRAAFIEENITQERRGAEFLRKVMPKSAKA